MKKKTIKAYDFFGGTTAPEPIKKKPKTITNSLTNQIVDYINDVAHSFAWRNNTSGTYNEALGKYIHSGATLGAPDVCAIYMGRFIGLEIKQGQDRLSPKQQKFKDRVEGSLGTYYEIRSFDQFLRLWNEATASIDLYDEAALDGLKSNINETIKLLKESKNGK